MKRLAIAVLVLLIVLSIPGAVGDEDSQIKIIFPNDWSGTIGTDGNTYSVEGSGNETFEMEGRNVVATIQKKDNGNGSLTVQILHDGDVLEEQTTTAGNGVVRVSHIFPAKSSTGDDDGGGVCCLLLLLVVIVVLMFLLKRYKHVKFRRPWVILPMEADRARDPSTNPVGHPRQPPPTKPPSPERPQ